MREAGNRLNSLTSLSLLIVDNRHGGSTLTTATLDEAMIKLAGLCLSLTSFTFTSHLPAAFLQTLGQSCPQLRQLTYACTGADNQTDLNHVLSLQPSLLPHLTTLTIHADIVEYKLSDMSCNPSITTLHLPAFTLKTKEEWLCLPPKLQHLKCYSFTAGPPLSPGRSSLLSELLSLELRVQPPNFTLHTISQLLRAAPAFQQLKCLPPPNMLSCSIDFDLHPSSAAETAVDLSFLNLKMELPFIRNATYSLSGMALGTGQSHSSVITSMPRMTGVASFRAMRLHPGDLGLLLKAFPDATDLGLHSCHGMTNVELQELAAGCLQLKNLMLAQCPSVSPVGLFSICQRLPQICQVMCANCPLLGELALQECEQLLRLQGVHTKLICQNYAH